MNNLIIYGDIHGCYDEFISLRKKKNPVILDNDEKSIIDNLDDNDIVYLKNMPLFLRFKGITVLHGGIQNNQSLNNIMNPKN